MSVRAPAPSLVSPPVPLIDPETMSVPAASLTSNPPPWSPQVIVFDETGCRCARESQRAAIEVERVDEADSADIRDRERAVNSDQLTKPDCVPVSVHVLAPFFSKLEKPR